MEFGYVIPLGVVDKQNDLVEPDSLKRAIEKYTKDNGKVYLGFNGLPELAGKITKVQYYDDSISIVVDLKEYLSLVAGTFGISYSFMVESESIGMGGYGNVRNLVVSEILELALIPRERLLW